MHELVHSLHNDSCCSVLYLRVDLRQIRKTVSVVKLLKVPLPMDVWIQVGQKLAQGGKQVASNIPGDQYSLRQAGRTACYMPVSQLMLVLCMGAAGTEAHREKKMDQGELNRRAILLLRLWLKC